MSAAPTTLPKVTESPSTLSSEEVAQEKTKWSPTAEEYQRYLAREVEMAKENIAKGCPVDVVLHSSRTVTLVREEMQKGK
jgi:hypothetical protein